MPRAPGTANCVIFAALSCAWTYGDIDEGTDVGTAAAADSQLYAAPAYGQPPAADRCVEETGYNLDQGGEYAVDRNGNPLANVMQSMGMTQTATAVSYTHLDV